MIEDKDMVVRDEVRKMKLVAPLVAALSNETRCAALSKIAEKLVEKQSEIFAENKKDLEYAEQAGVAAPIVKRLKFDEGKLRDVVAGINQLITLEDPIEYVHKHKKSVVNQREIGMDTLSYANALRAALREDPDIILVGEMRDLETISTAITAAETGHLVFSTLHTIGAASTIDRIVDVFPPHQQHVQLWL